MKFILAVLIFISATGAQMLSAMDIYYVDPAGVLQKANEGKLKSALLNDKANEYGALVSMTIRGKQGELYVGLLSMDKKQAVLLPVYIGKDANGNDILILKDEKYFLVIKGMNISENSYSVLIEEVPSRSEKIVMSFEHFWYEKLN